MQVHALPCKNLIMYACRTCAGEYVKEIGILHKRFTYREEDLRDKIKQKLGIRMFSTSSGTSLILTVRSLFIAFNFRMDAEILLECYLRRLVGVL